MRKVIIFAAIISLVPLVLAAGPLDTDKKISLQFEEVSISTILTMIAQRHNLNIVQSADISQAISVQLENVSLKDALDAILASNGYNYYQTGDIIVVKPFDMSVPGELSSRAFTLNYISPAAAANVIENLLSSKGKVKIIQAPGDAVLSGKASMPTQILVIDFPGTIQKIADLINEIDVAQKQVEIKVRLVETNVDNEKNIGISWPTSFKARLHGITTTTSDTESSGTETEALGQMKMPDGKWEWGRLSVEETSVMLNLLDSDGNSKLISDPHITTLDNHEAEIKVTTVIPIQTINRFSEGGAVQDIVTFQDEEVGITLKVTPHIAKDDEVLLEVYPTVAEIIGYSGSIDNQKPITSQRSVSAKISVKNNETAVIGGLLKENKIDAVDKLFILGSIPIIGNLFKHKTTQTENTELIIMITPTILGN